MSAAVLARTGSPFDLDDDSAYRQWRDAKLARQPRCVEDLIVDVADPRRLQPRERDALLERCRDANMAVYRSPQTGADKELPRLLAAQLGLHRLDANRLADEDGISQIAVRDGSAGSAADFIPYTERAIQWHTDGYYHPQQRRIRAMVLHCVRAAAKGGVNALMDHELAYISLRDADPGHVHALMAGDAMTIPARMGEAGIARPAQAGPVFAVDAADGALHMRYTARTRSIEWKADRATSAAVAFLRRLLASADAPRFTLRLEPGMGIVCNNVLHDRSAFENAPLRPRLLYRARFLDRVGQQDRG